jgi:hypothetical protein
MNAKKLQDLKIEVRLKLAGLWTSIMFFYVVTSSMVVVAVIAPVRLPDRASVGFEVAPARAFPVLS